MWSASFKRRRADDFVPCRNGRFERNIVVFRFDEARTAANIGPGTKPETFRFVGNAWYAIDRPDRSDRMARTLPRGETDGVYGVDPRFVAPDQRNYRVGKS